MAQCWKARKRIGDLWKTAPQDLQGRKVFGHRVVSLAVFMPREAILLCLPRLVP